ncbi:uncharacterized protein [Haliotis cracherodii]|uniref:uncharacterized protein n=1 Tax=Haliotis cracherodii TaxID=6455 RepID=UPI0039EA1384
MTQNYLEEEEGCEEKEEGERFEEEAGGCEEEKGCEEEEEGDGCEAEEEEEGREEEYISTYMVRNATIKNLTKTVPINVTQTHFWDVKLFFVCGNHQWNITPGVENELQSNRTNAPTTLSVGATTTEIPPEDVSTLLIVAAGVTSAVFIILIITIACCCCCCRKKVNPAATRQSNLPSESNMAYYEAGVSFQDVSKSNGINGSSESCATQCSVVTLRDTEDPHDSMGNGGSIYDRLYLN